MADYVPSTAMVTPALSSPPGYAITNTSYTAASPVIAHTPPSYPMVTAVPTGSTGARPSSGQVFPRGKA